MAATLLSVSEQLNWENVKAAIYSDRVGIYGMVTGKLSGVSECVKMTY
jgi:hypothetical protein